MSSCCCLKSINRNQKCQSFLTWSASRPKYLWLSKNLRVGSSVNGLVIMYQCIGVTLAEPGRNRVMRVAGRINKENPRCGRWYSPSFIDWAANLWRHKIRSAWSWKSDFPDGSPMSGNEKLGDQTEKLFKDSYNRITSRMLSYII